MKYVIAIIKSARLEQVRNALTDLGVAGMTATEVKGYGRQKGHGEYYRGTEYEVQYVPKLKLEIAVDDGLADQVADAVRTAANTDKIGDGKIFILDLEQALRIRSGESGPDAL